MSAPKLFLVTWDDHQGCCAIMCRDTDCEGAICAMGDKPALFTSRAAARRAIRISTKFAELQIEQGKPANDDFLGGRKNLRILPCETVEATP